jgi:hypothetical protein
VVEDEKKNGSRGKEAAEHGCRPRHRHCCDVQMARRSKLITSSYFSGHYEY